MPLRKGWIHVFKGNRNSGFKSFADKTKVVFDQGVTAVVGPNGSGKSNITESLRWALGESSVKSLRGGARCRMSSLLEQKVANRSIMLL